ncbi:hypothetical protein M407DRAFT_216875 [Tulasnella calospora MUT 4182]|uniref:Uncharacterized protein n=1 Tax=Tulasnella calospora MUT 4182 TaxID=1051891 RepID=A0A0C3Q1R4_9AGAM|nr:hypothetical protein M407DRAFT_216875 [Tulasnella calospora MUT 4182]
MAFMIACTEIAGDNCKFHRCMHFIGTNSLERFSIVTDDSAETPNVCLWDGNLGAIERVMEIEGGKRLVIAKPKIFRYTTPHSYGATAASPRSLTEATTTITDLDLTSSLYRINRTPPGGVRLMQRA